MGGKERVAAQKRKGNFRQRARINTLLDKDFPRNGMFARNRNVGAYEDVAADGVITATAKRRP